MTAESSAQDKYKHLSVIYLENSFRFLDKNEIEKASEMLWGAAAEAIKAVAAQKGILLKTHREIWNYAKRLTKDLEDEEIWHRFSMASFLHSNFYESSLEKDDIVRYAEDTRALVSRLLEFTE